MGTWGDFYGMGEHTGHLGVGLCFYHERGMSKSQAWESAKKNFEAIRTFGDNMTTGKEYEALTKLQAKEIEKYNDIQKGMDLVLDTLAEFKKKVASNDEKVTEWVSGAKGEGSVLVDASDVTRMDLALRIAKTITGIKKDEFQMSADDYLHVTEITPRLAKMMMLGDRMFDKLIALKDNFVAGNRDPKEQIKEEFLNSMKDIWKDAKSGEKDK